MLRLLASTFQLDDDFALLTYLMLHTCNLCLYLSQASLKGSVIHAASIARSGARRRQ
jgi:hypothetical protein